MAAFDISAKSIRLEFSPDNRHLAYVNSDRVVLFDTRSGKPQNTFQVALVGIEGLEFSPDGTLLAVAYQDRLIRLWDVESGDLVATLEGHQNAISDVHFVADRRTLISHDSHGFALWDIQTKRQFFYHEIGKSPNGILCKTDEPPKRIYGVVVSPRGNWMAVSTGGKNTCILDLNVSDIQNTKLLKREK